MIPRRPGEGDADVRGLYFEEPSTQPIQVALECELELETKMSIWERIPTEHLHSMRKTTCWRNLKDYGQYQSKDSDILVAIYNIEIIFFLVEEIWGGFFLSWHSAPKKLRILKRVTMTIDEYGEFIKKQAVRRITGEGKILEEIYLSEHFLIM